MKQVTNASGGLKVRSFYADYVLDTAIHYYCQQGSCRLSNLLRVSAFAIDRMTAYTTANLLKTPVSYSA